MEKQPLTPLKQEYLKFIQNFCETNKRFPRQIEVAKHFNRAKSATHTTLQVLESAGYIRYKENAKGSDIYELVE